MRLRISGENMEVTIIDIIRTNAKCCEEIKKSFREQLEEIYNYEELPLLRLTKEEAIKINMHDRKAINKAYFENLGYFKALANAFARNNTQKTQVYCMEDIINQIYIDMRYYDYTSESTLRRCLYTTCKTSNAGGIANYKKWRNEKRAACFLYDKISAHNSKQDDETSLIDLIGATEENNPETLLINESEREVARPYSDLMLNQFLELLPRSQRQKFIDRFGL